MVTMGKKYLRIGNILKVPGLFIVLEQSNALWKKISIHPPTDMIKTGK